MNEKTYLYCAKCGVKIKYSLILHWERVHWPHRTMVYEDESLYEGVKEEQS